MFSSLFSLPVSGNLEFGNYNNYKIWPYQVLGVCCAVLIFSIVLAGMVYSKMFNIFMKTPESEEKELEWVHINIESPAHPETDGDYVNMSTMDDPVMVSKPGAYYETAAVGDNGNVDTVDQDAAADVGDYDNMATMDDPVVVPPSHGYDLNDDKDTPTLV
jgi:hypothetical protein